MTVVRNTRPPNEVPRMSGLLSPNACTRATAEFAYPKIVLASDELKSVDIPLPAHVVEVAVSNFDCLNLNGHASCGCRLVHLEHHYIDLLYTGAGLFNRAQL